MISQTAEYAIRSVVCLAKYREASLTTKQIAKVTKVPVSYLSKVLQSLARSGIVRSQRGLHGGFTLAKPPEDLSLLDIINAVDPVKHIEQCPLDLEDHGIDLCPLHKRLNDAILMVEKAFKDSTVGDLLSEPTRSHPLCESPETKLELEKE